MMNSGKKENYGNVKMRNVKIEELCEKRDS